MNLDNHKNKLEFLVLPSSVSRSEYRRSNDRIKNNLNHKHQISPEIIEFHPRRLTFQ